ncbi:MAG TPA: hypothetical protein DCZ43_04625, partial [candidate division Zixibacteria bacterium]|nr:hypothetical protein [candidate division Zixibacteria bacterium]
MKYVFVLLLFSICLTGNIIAQQNDFVSGVDYLSQSVATVDRTNSGIVNPAALGFWTSMGLQYAHSFTDSTYKGDDGLLLASKGAFFSIEWLHHSTNISRRKYTLATGDRIFRNFYAGISYGWFSGPKSIYKSRKDWKIGLLYHPKPFASLGLVVDRINQPTFAGFKQKRLYQPGIGLRPFGEKLTFSADGLFLEGKALSHGHGIFRLVAGPFRGISLTTDYRNPREWRFGITYDVQQTRLGGQARLVRDTHYAGGTYFIEAGAEEFGEGIAAAPKTGSMILKGDIVEEPRSKPLFGQSKRSLYSVIRDLRRGATDPKIGGLLVKMEDVNLDFASAQELRTALSLYRANGKKVVTFMGEAGNLEYYLASVSDEIYMDPFGLLELKGLAATAQFYKGTLDKLGIRAEILATGPHKTYGDAFVDTTLTDAAREQINWLLDDLYGQFVEGISTGRGMTTEQVKASIDAGPYTSRDALKAGLIDDLKHYDELTENDAP